MKYAFLVALREYVENTKTKGFWIGLLIVPFIITLTAQVPVWLEKKGTPTRYFVLVDQSGEYAGIVRNAIAKAHETKVLGELNDYARKYAGTAKFEYNPYDPASFEEYTKQGGASNYLARIQPSLKPGAPPFKEPRRSFQEVKLPASVAPDAGLATLGQELKPYLNSDKTLDWEGHEIELSAAILIPRDLAKLIVRPGAKPAGKGSENSIEYWSANLTDAGLALREEAERAVNTEIRRQEYQARGLDITAVRQVEQTYAPFANLNPKKEAGREAVNTTDIIRQWAPSGFVYLLWLSIFTISQMLLQNIIEEKSNRIIEVLLSSVTPGELMMGKLFGIAAIGLTMVGAWLVTAFLILGANAGTEAGFAGQLLTVLKTSRLVPIFGVYFILGYLMYAAFILALGSVCNTLKEAQNYMGIITVIMMVPLMTMTFIPKDPNGSLARLLSWIPPYTPFVMMNRANADPPMIDLVGTLVLLVACTGFALWMSGKVFRIGILRTGQPPKILELIRWIKG